MSELSELKKEIKEFKNVLANQVSWNEGVPFDFELFYQDFGYITHATTGQPVERLTEYQYRTAKEFQQYRKLLEIKSNKIGESTKWLLIDFQLSVLPSSHPFSTRGYDTLVISQTKDHAKEHLRDLRKMLNDSAKYGKYLINKPDEIALDANDIGKILKDEQSKTGVIYIHNPERPTRPSRIIALGVEHDGAILSWKKVKHIHMSDITAAEGDFSKGIRAARTRLANTNGTMVIETVPGDPAGKIFEMDEAFMQQEWKQGDFYVSKVMADEAVKAGIMTQDFLDAERRDLGPLFDRYYGAKFGAVIGGVFTFEQIKAATENIAYDYRNISQVPVSLGIDMGFGSSRSAFVELGEWDGKLHVTHATEFERPDFNDMVHHAMSRITKSGVGKVFVDGSNPEYIKALKKLLTERTDYDAVMKDNPYYERSMKVVPVYFAQENLSMLTWAQQVASERQLLVHSDFKDLITQMRSARTNEKGTLDKKLKSFDLIDALFLALRLWKYK